MLLKTKGRASNIFAPIVGRITRDVYSEDVHGILITPNDCAASESKHFGAVLTNECLREPVHYPVVHSVSSFDHLAEGDVVVLNTDGVINTLYRVNSHYNFILTTERCNSNCLMCSQPPKDRNDIPYLSSIHRQLIPLLPKDCFEIGITGGEPTLMGESYFDLLQQIKTELPDTEVHCLTNGRSFAWPHIAQRLADIGFDRLMLGIPLYSDFYQHHDHIVQAKNAFNQTIQGLYNLGAHNLRLEIRIVLHKLSIPRLTQLARYIYRNLPFVEHVTFMGLEYQGYTPHNIQQLWVDPLDYMQELGEAVTFLASRRMNVSIYNSQLCIMPEELWQYNKRSISDWKNIYLEECTNCALKESCGGLFASNEKMHSKFIKRFQNASLDFLETEVENI